MEQPGYCCGILELVHLGAVLAAGEIPAAPVVGVMAFGIVMAIVGHISKRNLLVGLGIGILFLATVAMVVLAYIEYSSGTSFDPRPKDPKLPPQVYE